MIRIGPPLITSNVYSRITSLDVFEKYCPNFKEIGRSFPSMFRNDLNPSVQISIIGNDLLYKDFGEEGSYRAIPFVARLFGTDYRGALEIINKDFKLGLGESLGNFPSKPVNAKAREFFEKCSEISKVSLTEILIKKRDFTLEDLTYWGQYYWTLEMLNSTDIVPISHFWSIKASLNKKDFFVSDKYSYSFDYYFHKGVFRRKIYQPFNKPIKFVSNVDYSIVQGYKRLSKTGRVLFITSSLKDCGPFWRLGYDAIAPNSETSFFTEEFVQKLKQRFTKIIVWFDNDWDKKENTGVQNAIKFSTLFNLNHSYNPTNFPKDPSDFCKEHSLNEFNYLINKSLI